MIRKANKSDIKRIIELLHQVNMVHHVLRPDLFKPHTTKYHEQELEDLLNDESRPIFGSVRKKPSAGRQMAFWMWGRTGSNC